MTQAFEIEITDEEQLRLNLAVFASLTPAQRKAETKRMVNKKPWSKEFRRRATLIYIMNGGDLKNLRPLDYQAMG